MYINGVTIEWINIAKGLKSKFRHFEIVPLGVWSLQRFYPVVKKHINLSHFNVDIFIADYNFLST